MTVFLTAMLFGTPAQASPRCATPDQLEQLDGFAGEIAEAETTEEAQAMALRKLDRSRGAVKRARAIVPNDAGLAEADAKLADLEARVRAADSPAKVSAAVAQVAKPAGVNCDFTTGEIVAIAIGFLFAILPGVLLLVLLC